MANNSILKLQVDDREYEASLKQAKQGMQDLQHSLQAAGKSFTQVDEKIVEYARALGNMESTAKGSKGQLRELSQTLTDITIVYRQMTDEEKSSPFGQALSKSIDQLTQRASVIKDAMADVEKSISHAASDTRTFDQLAQGMSVATAGFQGLTGAGKLLGIEMGNDVEVIAKLQAAMAVTNSLTTIQTALQEESALVQGINAIKTKAAAVAQSLLAKNTLAATAAGRAFNVVAKASPWGLVLSGIAAVVAAMSMMSDKTEEVSEEQKNLQKQLETTKGIQESYASALASSMASLMSKYESLRAAVSKLQTEAEKVDFINNHKKDFDSLGLSINSISNLEDTFVNNTASVVEAFRKRAEAAAAMTAVQKAYEEYFKELEQQNNNVRDRAQFQAQPSLRNTTVPDEWKTAGLEEGTHYKKTMEETAYGLVASYEILDKGIEKLQESAKANLDYQLNKRIEPYLNILREAQDLNTTGGGGGGGSNNIPIVKPDEIFPEGSLKALQQQMQKLQEAQGLVTDTSSWRELQQQIDAITNRVSILKGELPKDKVFSLQFENADSLQGVLDQMKAIKGVTIDEKTLTVTADTSEAMRQVQQLTENIEGTTVELKVKPVELAVGISGTNEGTISSFIQQLQQELESIDFSVAGSFQKATNLNANIIDATTLGNLLKTSIQNGIDLAAAGIDIESLFDKIASGEGIENADWKGLAEKINEQLKAQGIELNIDTKTGNVSSKKNEANTTAKAIEKFNSDYSKLTGGVSSIVSGIQSMGVEIPKEIQSVLGVLTGISSIMSGIASILTVIQVAATVSAAKPFARGGIVHAAGGYVVPGNNFSGDMVPAYLNSQEMVLNRQQQMILAGTLENNGMKNINISGALRGEDIVLVADRFGKRTGKGELAFWKN